MASDEKTTPIKNADDGDRLPVEPATTPRTKGQQDKSDARLKDIIARAVEKVKRPVTVDDQTNTYPPKVAPFIKKTRPKGRDRSR